MAPLQGKKVVVAMSGGVDSSVAAALLQEAGAEVVGCFMRLGSADGPEIEVEDAACDPTRKTNRQGCCSVNDAADARLVAAMLDVPFYVLNFRRDFGRVMDYFVDEYNAGRTPNPCVRCNDWLKFGKLFDYADSIDADYVASGHYARIARQRAGSSPTPADRAGGELTTGEAGPGDGPARYGSDLARLVRGIDQHKDQSYVLFGTKRDRLDRMLLPIGDYHKADVRAMAQQRGLPVFDKPDSYEICFVPDNDYRGFIERHAPGSLQSGRVIDADGQAIGEHEGHQTVTIGQRRGLGVSVGLPIYVTDKDPATNTVTIGDQAALAATGLTANQTNWLVEPPTDWRPCDVQIRSNSKATPGRCRATGADTLEVELDPPQDAVTPGQAVVCYDGDELLGGGWITEAKRP